MIACPICGAENLPQSLKCRQCGRALAAGSGIDMPTLRYQGPPLGTRGPSRKVTPLAALFAVKKSLVIGRYADCDICLSHPTISRWHALLEQLPDGRLQLIDLGSVNGVTVNGRRITGSTIVADRMSVAIGPFLLSTANGELRTIDSSQSIRLEARRLEKTVRLKDGRPCLLLDDVNLVIEPGEFVSLLGPSGSGKSTLMDCLNGRRWATGGQVLANGENFYRFFDSFRQSLGYVPQKDIVHAQLTVYRALSYTARLRLPPDTDREELEARLFDVLRLMELQPHRDTLIANLSGGQVKRVSLGAELLARPCLLFIDEATSGLDAGTEARMMRLFRQLADEGKSLICITHNVENVGCCHLVLILSHGRLVFYGPPAEAPAFFGVNRITEIYDRLTERDPAEWEACFRASDFHKEFVAKRQSADQPAPTSPAPPLLPLLPVSPSATASMPVFVNSETRSEVMLPRGSMAVAVRFRPRRPPLWHQFRVLMARYADLLWSDSRSLRLIFFQAPVVAIILIIGFANKPYERTQPRLRHLSKQEKEILLVLKAIERDTAPASSLDGAAKIDDLELHLVDPLNEKRTIRAADVRKMIVEFEREPVGSARWQYLKSAKIEIAVGDEVRMPIDLQHMIDLQQILGEQQLPSRLLALDAEQPVVPGKNFIDPTYTYMLLFILVIIVFWFGCSNSAKEIVKEEAIYGRERAVNLGILPYLASKFLILTLITLVQASVLMGLVFGALEAMHSWNPACQVPPDSLRVGYPAMFGVLALLSMTSVALGLLLSSSVSSADRANTLLPYVLIPQIILGGGTLPVKEGVLYYLAFVLSPVYWAFRGVRLGANDLPDYVGYRTDDYESAWFACAMLAAQMIVLFGLTVLCMRAKDVKRA